MERVVEGRREADWDWGAFVVAWELEISNSPSWVQLQWGSNPTLQILGYHSSNGPFEIELHVGFRAV